VTDTADTATATPLPPADGPADLGTALKVYLLAQLGRIDEHLKHRGRHPHAAVHEARKAVRRFRSVAALCRSVAPEQLPQAGLRIRGIGKKLSRLRDAHVVTETAATQRRLSTDAQSWRLAQQALKTARDALRQQMLEEDPGFGLLRKRARRTARQLRDMDFGALDGQAILLALRRSAARMRKAESDAKDKPRATVRHRWRRRVRRLRLQLECLQQIADDEYTLPAVRAQARRLLGEAAETFPPAASLSALADRLGGQQDIANLRSALRRLDDLPFRDALLQALKPRRGS
jgi:CHAD domain-containing protein